MMSYSSISLAVTFGVLAAGAVGFVAGWLAHRALTRERMPPRELEDYYDV